MSRVVLLMVGFLALGARAAPRTVVVSAGDCGDAALASGQRDFREAAAATLGDGLLDDGLVLDLVRPRAARSLQDIERQVESAKALLYAGQAARGLEVVDRALLDLERVSPADGPWPVTRGALVLRALLSTSLERPRDLAEAFRRVLRVEPAFKLDPDAHPPSALAALEAVRRELAHARKAPLAVRVEAGPPAAVFLDGAPVGATPLELELVPGTYRLALVSGDAVSFARKVELPRDGPLSVDLRFEGALSLQPPLCVQGADDLAPLKLAQLATADRLIVLRNTATRGSPPYLSGALYEVATGQQARAGAVQPGFVGNLATFLVTGKAQLGVEAPRPAKAQSGAPALAPARAEGPAAPEVAPAVSPTFDARRASTGQVASGVLLGAGVMLGVAGAVIYAAAAPGRLRLAGLTGADGQLPTAGTSAHREALQLLTSLDTTRSVAFGLLGVAVGAAVGGALGLALFSPGAAQLTVAPAPGGAALSLSGRF